MEIPRRISLVVQTADVIRRNLQRGVWRDHLPGEIPLSKHLQVSRPTVSAALRLLRREGWFEVAKGRRRRILRRCARRSLTVDPKRVVVLGTVPYHQVSSFSLFLINQLQTRLHPLGYQMEFHTHPRFAARHSLQPIKSLVDRVRADCWVLTEGSAAVQRWFARFETPAMVLTSARDDGVLPCLGADYRALAHHAVGLFLARGHRRIALLTPRMASLDRNPIGEGFVEAFHFGPEHAGAVPRIVYHNETIDGIRSALEAQFRSKAPPDALLVVRPKHVLTAMSCLMNLGLRLPRDVSLISAGYLPILDGMVPSVAHYSVNWNAFSRCLCRMVIRALQTGPQAPTGTLMMPEFHDGETLGAKAV